MEVEAERTMDRLLEKPFSLLAIVGTQWAPLAGVLVLRITSNIHLKAVISTQQATLFLVLRKANHILKVTIRPKQVLLLMVL